MFVITKKKQLGVTLLEVILVLVIAAALIALGFRQYLILRNDSSVLQAQANVDTIFQALGLYYKANCYGMYAPDRNPPFIPGSLNPAANPPQQKPINIRIDLVNAGYLVTQSPTIVPITPIVNNDGTGGYVAQFNEYTQTRYVCSTSSGGSTGPTPTQGCQANIPIGEIIIWKPQVSILLADPTAVATYQRVMNADCSSRLSGGIVLPCSRNAPGPYLVWERLPSMATPSNTSDYWLTNPTTKQFNQMYTTYPINYLTSTTPTTGLTPDGQPQYFLCGG